MAIVKQQSFSGEATSRPVRLDGAVRGDRHATSQVLGEILPRIRNLVRYLGQNQIEAEDITQDAAMMVLKSLHTYRGDGFFEHWVDRIVTRTMFAAIKRRRRFDRVVAVLAGVCESREAAALLSSDEQLAGRYAWRMLDQIPIDQRQVLLLRHVHEMTVPEIAALLEIPFETVRSRLRLGRERLRQRVC